MKASDFLKETKETLRKHGWIQRGFGTESTGFCMSGALLHTARKFGVRPSSQRVVSLAPLTIERCWDSAYGFLQEVCRKSGYATIVAFNDIVAKSEDDVYAALDEAIAAAEAAEKGAQP